MKRTASRASNQEMMEGWNERIMAGETGLEPAASGVTGRRYNQLNYSPLQSNIITENHLSYQPDLQNSRL